MEMNKWAENEVRLAKEREKRAAEEEGSDVLLDYTLKIYDAALDIFNQICEQGHSGMSIKRFQGILNALIDGRNLTPIEDVDEEWEEKAWKRDDGGKHYQAKRCPSLFKTVYPGGWVAYSDHDRAYFKNQRGGTFTCRLCTDLINELHPISFPYVPVEQPYRFYVLEYDDVTLVLSVREPDGTSVPINRAFDSDDKEIPYKDGIELAHAHKEDNHD